MSKKNLTKEEMSDYIKITNFLANNESDINSILARDRDEFNKDGLYSNTNWKMNNTLRAFYFSSITTIMLFILLVIVFGPMNIVPLCVVILFSFFLSLFNYFS